jgi:GNAT superfamily N-acetyltransferase
MPNSSLEISMLKPEEAPQYMRIRHEAFRPTVNRILYPKGEPSQKTFDRVISDIQNDITNKGYLYLKCVDTATGEIIAGAKWRYVTPKTLGATERTWEEVEAAFQDRMQPYDESEPALLNELFEIFNEHKRRHLGNRPYYALDTLATHQDHGRRGAGSMLVRWGCEKADEAGVQAYLEASPMGAPMYARYGFVEVARIRMDLTKNGGQGTEDFIVSTVFLRQHGAFH